MARSRPVAVADLAEKPVVAIACGHYHGLALMRDEAVWAWGVSATSVSMAHCVLCVCVRVCVCVCVCVCLCVGVCVYVFREGILATLSYSGVYSPYAQSQEIVLSKTAPRLSTSVLYQKRQRALQVRGVVCSRKHYR